MSETKGETIALNVRLKPSEPSAHPRATNYTNVGAAQGIAYLNSGFIEPWLEAGSRRTRGLHIKGHEVTREWNPRDR